MKQQSLLVNDEVRACDRTLAQLVLAYQGGFGFESHLFIPTRDNLEALLQSIDNQRTQLQKQDLGPFWSSHFDSVLRGLRFAVVSHTLYPYNYIHGVGGFLNRLMVFEGSEPAEKVQQATGKLDALQQALPEVIALLADLPTVRRTQVSNSCQAIAKLLQQVAPFFAAERSRIASGEYAKWERSLQGAEQALERAFSDLERMPQSNTPREAQPFDLTMQDSLQVPLDFILSWCEDDFVQRKEEFHRLAAQISPGRDPFDVLKDSPGYAGPPALFADARQIVSIMREYARHYVTLPEGEECEVGPVAEQSKVDCPTANCGGADMWRGTLRSRMGLNEDNYTAFNRASLWGTVAHECYPGHHTNAAKGAAVHLPWTFRIRLPLSRPMVEGVAHRSETLMAPHYEDDLARLATARRVLYCAARVKAEMDLNHHQRPAEELLRMYREDMQVNEMTARLQVQAHLMYPGDAISYYTGARVLESYRQRLGVDAVSFTEPIFSFGYVSLETMQRLVSLSVADQEAIKAFDQ